MFNAFLVIYQVCQTGVSGGVSQQHQFETYGRDGPFVWGGHMALRSEEAVFGPQYNSTKTTKTMPPKCNTRHSEETPPRLGGTVDPEQMREDNNGLRRKEFAVNSKHGKNM